MTTLSSQYSTLLKWKKYKNTENQFKQTLELWPQEKSCWHLTDKRLWNIWYEGHLTTAQFWSPPQALLLLCGLYFIRNQSLLHRPGHRSEAFLITPAFSWRLSAAPSKCLTLRLYFPDGPWCFLSLHACLKARPYPQAATLITSTHTNTCVHTVWETAGALGTWNTYIKEKRNAGSYHGDPDVSDTFCPNLSS